MKIFTLNMFFLKEPVLDLQDLINLPNKYTLNIETELSEFIAIINNNRNKYIEDGILTCDGGLLIQQNNKEILGVKQWDDLPTLWSYMLNVTEEYMEDGFGSSYFPSQPIAIRLQTLPNKKIEFVIGDNRLECDTKIFISTILNQAEVFFNILIKEFSLDKYKYEIEQIKKLKTKI